MEFKIGSVAKMTGLSPSGIRFLEEQGFLTPSGGRKGTYRSYTLSDVSTVLDYRNYRMCGLSQEEILRLFSGEEDSSVFDRRCDDLERQLMETTRLLHFLRHRRQDAVNIHHADVFWEITERPAIICMPLDLSDGNPAGWPEDTGFEIPYADSVLTFDPSSIADASCSSPVPAAGIGMLETDVLNVSFLGHSRIRYYGIHPAFHCIVEITEDFHILPSNLERCRSFLQAAFKDCCLDSEGFAISKRILTSNKTGRSRRFDNLWIDVKKNSN